MKRPFCSPCSINFSPWGKTSAGKKRFRCRSCGDTRIYHPNKVKKVDFFELFRQQDELSASKSRKAVKNNTFV